MDSLTRPVFLSATSGDLRSACSLVAEILSGMGYSCRTRAQLPFTGGDLRDKLRSLIDECGLVIQLVGFRFGRTSGETHPELGELSYTQFEATYAESVGKKVLYITLNDDFQFDVASPEDPQLVSTQTAYRDFLKRSRVERGTSSSREQLSTLIYQMRDDLKELRQVSEERYRTLRRDTRTTKSIVLWSLMILAIVSIGVATVLLIQKRTSQGISEIQRYIKDTSSRASTDVTDFTNTVAETKRQNPDKPTEEVYEIALQSQSRTLGKEADLLRREFASFTSLAETDLEKAQAAMTNGDLAGAEKLAAALGLRGKALLERAEPEVARARKATADIFRFAARAAMAQARYVDAEGYLRDALASTDRAQDSGLWTETAVDLANVLDELGKRREASLLLEDAIKEIESHQGREAAPLAGAYRIKAALAVREKNWDLAESLGVQALGIDLKHGPNDETKLKGDRNIIHLAAFGRGDLKAFGEVVFPPIQLEMMKLLMQSSELSSDDYLDRFVVLMREKVRPEVVKQAGEESSASKWVDSMIAGYQALRDDRMEEAGRAFRICREITISLWGNESDEAFAADFMIDIMKTLKMPEEERMDETVAIFERLLRKLPGPEFAGALVQVGFGSEYVKRGMNEKGIKLLNKGLPVLKQTPLGQLGPYVMGLNSLDVALIRTGRASEALGSAEECEQLARKLAGENLLPIREMIYNHARVLQETKQFDRALPLFQEVLGVIASDPAALNEMEAPIRYHLARTLEALERHAEAKSEVERAVTLFARQRRDGAAPDPREDDAQVVFRRISGQLGVSEDETAKALKLLQSDPKE